MGYILILIISGCMILLVFAVGFLILSDLNRDYKKIQNRKKGNTERRLKVIG